MFGVYDGGNLQGEYQRFIEQLLRRLTEMENQLKSEMEKDSKDEEKKTRAFDGKGENKKIEIFDGEGNLLYGEGGKVCEITPDQAQKLSDASMLPAGAKLEGLPSLDIQVEGESFFKSEDGTVLVNNSSVGGVDKVESPLNVKVLQADEYGESELLYGKVGQRQINRLTELQLERIEDVATESEFKDNFSKHLPELADVTIRVNDEVVFRVDEKGKLLTHDPKLTEAFNQISQGAEEKEKAVVSPKPSKPKAQERWDEYEDDFDFDLSPDVFENSIPAPVPELEPEVASQEVVAEQESQPQAQAEVTATATPSAPAPAPEVTVQEVVAEQEFQPQPTATAAAPESEVTVQELDDISYQILIEMIVPMVEALPPVEVNQVKENEAAREVDSFLESPTPSSQNIKEETSEVSQVLPQQEQKTGIQAASEALSQMPNSPTKTVVESTVAEMGATLPVQQPDATLDNLGAERARQPQNSHWWQELGNKIEVAVSSVRDAIVGHRAASTVKDFAQSIALPPGGRYEGAEYNIQREGKDYTLTDKEGNELLKFQSTPLGVKVDKSLPALDERHFRKTEELRHDQKQGLEHKGSFVSEGVAEAQHLQRLARITQGMSQYAASCGGKANVEGKFSYDWKANDSGSAMITNKKGEVLLAVGEGQMRTRMSEKDLQHFEQMLPALQGVSAKSQQAPAAATAAKNKGMER